MTPVLHTEEGVRACATGATRFEGVQFNPESILTEDGKKLLKNFLAGY